MRRGQQKDGLLFKGDNAEVLKYLRDEMRLGGEVRLIYADPPFGTGQDFVTTATRAATVSRPNGGELAYSDKLRKDAYLAFLRTRLSLMRDLLAEDGSIYVHIDIKMGHYVKCLMDEIFGAENFINDITRIKCNPKNFKRQGYGNIKDLILFSQKH